MQPETEPVSELLEFLLVQPGTQASAPTEALPNSLIKPRNPARCDQRFIPPPPQGLAETGLSTSVIEQLILKFLYFRGELMSSDLSRGHRLDVQLHQRDDRRIQVSTADSGKKVTRIRAHFRGAFLNGAGPRGLARLPRK